jgi:hypothetical protein
LNLKCFDFSARLGGNALLRGVVESFPNRDQTSASALERRLPSMPAYFGIQSRVIERGKIRVPHIPPINGVARMSGPIPGKKGIGGY